MIPYPFKSFPVKNPSYRAVQYFDGLAQIEYRGPGRWAVLDFKARRQGGQDSLDPDKHLARLTDFLRRGDHGRYASEIDELLKSQKKD